MTMQETEEFKRELSKIANLKQQNAIKNNNNQNEFFHIKNIIVKI